MLQHLKGYQRSITLIKTGRLNKKTTQIQILIHEKKRKETEGETNISMCNSSASTNTSTYTINSKSSTHTSWLFYYSWSQINNNFNIFTAVMLPLMHNYEVRYWAGIQTGMSTGLTRITDKNSWNASEMFRKWHSSCRQCLAHNGHLAGYTCLLVRQRCRGQQPHFREGRPNLHILGPIPFPLLS